LERLLKVVWIRRSRQTSAIFSTIPCSASSDMSTIAAFQAVKALRLKAVKNLPGHIIRLGPLPPTTELISPGTLRLPNPFVPLRNPRTGQWRPAKISLRRQADLVKQAKKSNTLHLLPPGPKTPRPTEQTLRAAAEMDAKLAGNPTRRTSKGYKEEEDTMWMSPVAWEGKAEYKEVAGAELGTRLYAAKKRMFKGHRWERVKEARDSKKKILLRDMARRVRNYKAVRLSILFNNAQSYAPSTFSTIKRESRTPSNRPALPKYGNCPSSLIALRC
jgi:large subunit ribosomal protein L25